MICRRTSSPLAGAAVALALLGTSGVAQAATLTVGPGKTYDKPCKAFAAASDGDTIEIDAAGNYDGDVCELSKNNLTIRGVGGGRAHIDAAGKNAQGKGIWVISGKDTVVENIELSGAKVADKNGAGIRQQGTNLTVRNCYFHDNEDGILSNPDSNSTILIEHSEFAHNGAGDGYSHNLYIGHNAKLIFQYNYTHAASVGHTLKTRAAENHILYNRITEEDGTGSYEIDVPNGGRTFIIGNLVQQGSQTQNPAIVRYREEGADPANPSDELYVVNNTFVNDRPSGGTFLGVDAGVATPAIVKNNAFIGPGTVLTQMNAVQADNFTGNDAMLVDPASFDYHPKTGSPLVDKGGDPGMGGGMALTPVFHYVHPLGATGRKTVGTIDIGAYELNGDSGSGAGGAGGAGSGGSGQGGGEGGASPTGSGGSGGATDGAGGNAGSGGSADTGDKGGCGCRAAGADGTSFGALLAPIALASIAALRRTRRRCVRVR